MYKSNKRAQQIKSNKSKSETNIKLISLSYCKGTPIKILCINEHWLKNLKNYAAVLNFCRSKHIHVYGGVSIFIHKSVKTVFNCKCINVQSDELNFEFEFI